VRFASSLGRSICGPLSISRGQDSILYGSSRQGRVPLSRLRRRGDVFQFVRLLHGSSFRQSVEFLAARAGIRIDGFRPPPELIAKVSALKAQREEQSQLERFCAARIESVNQRYRSLGRAANHAEDCLRAGESDPYIHDLAWSALQRFVDFQIRIEREGLADLSVLREEWEQMREVA